VSSTAATKSRGQKGNSSWKTQWPNAPRFKRAWLKKRRVSERRPEHRIQAQDKAQKEWKLG
jgi:hypothetical protein